MKKGIFGLWLAAALAASASFSAFGGTVGKQVLQPEARVELGKHFVFVDIVLDPARGELTAHVLDAATGKPARVVQEALRITGKAEGKPFTLKLYAVENPLTGEKKWDTSVFSGSDKALEGAESFEGILYFIRVEGANFRQVRFKCPMEGMKREQP